MATLPGKVLRKNFNSKSYLKTIKPLFILMVIFCLEWNSKNNTRSICTARRLITALIYGALHFFGFLLRMIYVYEHMNMSVVLTNACQAFYDYCQYLVDLFFVYKYGSLIGHEYFRHYRSFDKILYVVPDFVIRKRMEKIFGFLITLWIASTILDFVGWYLSFGVALPLSMVSSYFFLLIKMLTTLDLTMQLMRIEYRLKAISEVLHACYMTAEFWSKTSHLNIIIEDVVCNKNWFYSDSCPRPMRVRKQSRVRRMRPHIGGDDVDCLSICYRMLMEQCAFINTMYGIRVLTISLGLLLDMLRYINVSVKIILGTLNLTYDVGNFPAFFCLARISSCAIVLITIVDQCEKVYRQRTRILAIIDHLLLNKNIDVELRASTSRLREFVESTPISFTANNFFELSYSLLVSFTAALVSYTIILIQSIN